MFYSARNAISSKTHSFKFDKRIFAFSAVLWNVDMDVSDAFFMAKNCAGQSIFCSNGCICCFHSGIH